LYRNSEFRTKLTQILDPASRPRLVRNRVILKLRWGGDCRKDDYLKRYAYSIDLIAAVCSSPSCCLSQRMIQSLRLSSITIGCCLCSLGTRVLPSSCKKLDPTTVCHSLGGLVCEDVSGTSLLEIFVWLTKEVAAGAPAFYSANMALFLLAIYGRRAEDIGGPASASVEAFSSGL
jgi:hypothetical protein